jgi:drug/metabolite transporter (DMT)-like permease
VAAEARLTDRSTARAITDHWTLASFLLLVVLVGANLVAIRYSNRELAPFWNAGARFILAAGLFGALHVIRRVRTPTRRELIGGVAYGLLSFAGFFGFLYLGLVRATTALGQTILALGPLITMFLAAAIGMERLQPRAVLGGAICLVGIALSVGAAAALNVPPASLLALGAATTSFAAGTIVGRRMRTAEPVNQNLIACLVGGAVLLAISILIGEPWRTPADPATWIAFLYLVGPGTFIVFLLFLSILRRWTVTAVSYQFVLAPIVAIVLATVLLDEPVGPSLAAGIVLVLAGVYVGALSPRASAAGAGVA